MAVNIPIQDAKYQNYKRLLAQPGRKFLNSWGGAVLRNFDSRGELLKFKTLADYKNQDQPMWVLLQLLIFKDEKNIVFKTFACEICMKNIKNLSFRQNRNSIAMRTCHHAKCAEFFFKFEDLPWELWGGEPNLDNKNDAEQVFNLTCNRDVAINSWNTEDNGILAASRENDNTVTLMFTVLEGKRQKQPLCNKSSCSKETNCLCWKKFRKI